MALKKIMITPYFGELPPWMNNFSIPPGYDWLFDRDIEKFRIRVKTKLGIEYPGLPGTGKIWDYRCALGLLYEEEIKSYDFFGHCDFDMVFGDVDKWFDDATLNELDIWSNHDTYICGPWTLYRNTVEVRNLFILHPKWADIMTSPEVTGW